MAKKYELPDVGNISAEEYEALKVVLEQATHLKNPETEVKFTYDSKEKKFYTNNQTTKRLYCIMKDYVHEEGKFE